MVRIHVILIALQPGRAGNSGVFIPYTLTLGAANSLKTLVDAPHGLVLITSVEQIGRKNALL
jgi:hypothetical protein